MKKVFALTAAAILAGSGAHAAIIFDPANSLNEANRGGFTGVGTAIAGDPYTRTFLRFTFSSLNPSPLSTPFVISGIQLTGAGITGSLSFGDLTITENGQASTGFAQLSTSVTSVDFSTSFVSFNIPGGVVNDGASFSLVIRYQDSGSGDYITTSTPITFAAEAIPEPGTWAAAALLVSGAAFMRWRRRKVA